jgi:integrase
VAICPECGSELLYRDGLRYTGQGSSVQRFLCRSCGYRFSDPDSHVEQFKSNSFKSCQTHYKHQVCAILQDAKNLSTVKEKQTFAGEQTTQHDTIDARILQYEWKCKMRGLAPETILKRKQHLSRLVRDGADLDNCESVETTLTTADYKTPTKWLLVNAYRSYCKMFAIQWEPIRVKYQPKVPYIPTEEECKIFIAGLSKTLAIFCKTLFETGARRGELTKLEWQDIDGENCTISINHPEKGSNARTVKVSRECTDLLYSLQKKYGTYVFNPRTRSIDGSFQRQRARLAAKLQKPQFLKIHFHTFRHVRGTLDVHNHVPLFEVKERLGHKFIGNTEKYVHWNRQLYHDRNDRYYFAAVSTVEEAQKLIETGYEYVTDMQELKLFRKPR